MRKYIASLLIMPCLLFNVCSVVRAQSSGDTDDNRIQALAVCDSSHYSAIPDNIRQDKALANGTLSDNIRDVEDAYEDIAGCYGNLAASLLFKLPRPCHDVSLACDDRADKLFRTQSYACAHAAGINVMVAAAEQEVYWWQRADSLGSNLATRGNVQQAERDLKDFQKYACRNSR
jgi:hypothetical protein